MKENKKRCVEIDDIQLIYFMYNFPSFLKWDCIVQMVFFVFMFIYGAPVSLTLHQLSL